MTDHDRFIANGCIVQLAYDRFCEKTNSFKSRGRFVYSKPDSMPRFGYRVYASVRLPNGKKYSYSYSSLDEEFIKAEIRQQAMQAIVSQLTPEEFHLYCLGPAYYGDKWECVHQDWLESQKSFWEKSLDTLRRFWYNRSRE